MSEIDVLVVGGGPAGSSTAYHLARHGVDALVVDRSHFPREKVCGDGLTPRGVKALLDMGVDPTSPGFVRMDGLRSHGDGFAIDLRWPTLSSFPSYGVVRTRHDLDHVLIQRATSSGARLWEGTDALGPVLDEVGWVVGARVRRDGGDVEEVRARFVVACDGASSRFAAQAGVRRNPGRPIGVAARRYFRSPRADRPFFESWLDLRDGDATLPGYGWIFPVGGGVVNVGAGLLNSYRDFRQVSARGVLDLFLRQVSPEWELTEESAAGPVLSGPLPMGMNRGPLAVPGLLVAGDAGGLVNPFNGEGIAYAMESGQLAAELIHESLLRRRPAVAHVYPLLLKRRYGRYYAAGRAFARLIGNPAVMRASVRYALPRKRLMSFFLRLLANISDGPDGDVDDRLMAAIIRMAPER